MSLKEVVFDKFQGVFEKIELLIYTINEKEGTWDPAMVAGNMNDILEIVETLDTNIDNLQYQLDKNCLQPSERDLERIKEYEIEKQVLSKVFPYLYLFHNYYRNIEI